MKNKCNILIFILILVTPIFIWAQEEEKDPTYLFDSFQPGTVTFKDGTQLVGILNYNMELNKMVYIDETPNWNNTYNTMEFSDPSKIVSFNLNGRIFEHKKNAHCYEKITMDNVVLYIDWRLKPYSLSRDTSHGESQLASVQSIRSKQASPSSADLKTGMNFKYRPNNIYYLEINGKSKKFFNQDNFIKLFDKEHRDDIKKFIEEGNLDFSDADNVKVVVAYCSKFIKD